MIIYHEYWWIYLWIYELVSVFIKCATMIIIENINPIKCGFQVVYKLMIVHLVQLSPVTIVDISLDIFLVVTVNENRWFNDRQTINHQFIYFVGYILRILYLFVFPANTLKYFSNFLSHIFDLHLMQLTLTIQYT